MCWHAVCTNVWHAAVLWVCAVMDSSCAVLHAVLRCAVPCCAGAVLCCAMLCCALGLCCAVLGVCAELWCAMLCCMLRTLQQADLLVVTGAVRNKVRHQQCRLLDVQYNLGGTD